MEHAFFVKHQKSTTGNNTFGARNILSGLMASLSVFLKSRLFKPPALNILFERIYSAQQGSEGDGSGGRIAELFTIRCEDVDIGFEDAE